ncbi:MAG: replicative helicase loader/inhibitor [Oscillospiraceae bacterium]
MNRAEMTEIFAVLMLAYSNAEMFKAESHQALKQKLEPVITLWTTCFADLDNWTAQRAVVKVCRTCKFQPSIAEMQAAVDAVVQETETEIRNAYLAARSELMMREGNTAEAYKRLPLRSRRTIDAMGGMDKFCPPDSRMLDMRGFEQTYERLLRKNPIGLPDGGAGHKKLT